MDTAQHEQMLLALVGASIRGMQQTAQEANFPPIDDAIIFDVACILAATLIEASPEFADAKRFGKAADMARGKILDELRHARLQSEALGTKMLYKHIEAATGAAPAMNDR